MRWSPGLWDSEPRGFHVLPSLSHWSLFWKDSRMSKPYLESWGNLGHETLVETVAGSGQGLRTLPPNPATCPHPWESRPQPKSPASFLPTARPEPHAARGTAIPTPCSPDGLLSLTGAVPGALMPRSWPPWGHLQKDPVPSPVATGLMRVKRNSKQGPMEGVRRLRALPTHVSWGAKRSYLSSMIQEYLMPLRG